MTQQLQSGGFAWPAPRLAAMLCAALVFATVPFGPAWTAAAAASINGVGMRTYSMFRIHIYVAGLYLEQPTSDADAILKSDGAKLLDIHFVHDVNAEQARDAWVQGFEENCRAPCHLNGQDLLHFLAQVPAFRRGDESTLLFVGRTVQISLNGRTMGTISDADFTRAILATFIGPHPPSEPFKNGLLGMPN
jgi:hypothetical protein